MKIKDIQIDEIYYGLAGGEGFLAHVSDFNRAEYRDDSDAVCGDYMYLTGTRAMKYNARRDKSTAWVNLLKRPASPIEKKIFYLASIS